MSVENDFAIDGKKGITFAVIFDERVNE